MRSRPDQAGGHATAERPTPGWVGGRSRGSREPGRPGRTGHRGTGRAN